MGKYLFRSAFRGCYTVKQFSPHHLVCALPMERHRFAVAAVSLAEHGKGQVFATGWWAGRGWL